MNLFFWCKTSYKHSDGHASGQLIPCCSFQINISRHRKIFDMTLKAGK